MSPRVFAVWVTGAEDGLDHAVSEDAMAAGIDEGKGRFTAFCGVIVLAAPMIEPPGRRCRRCAELLYLATRQATGPQRRSGGTRRARHRLSSRRPSLLARLLCQSRRVEALAHR
jgi:hypothetical protein